MIVWRRLAGIVAEEGAAALVSVHRVRGSAPREEGARMIVRPDGAFHGTIGGGRLEWEALAAARAAVRAGRGPARFIEQALGPDLGQCCGGRVTLLIETFDARDAGDLARLAAFEREGALKVEALLDESGRVRRATHPSPLVGEGREGGCWAWNASGPGPGDLHQPLASPCDDSVRPQQPPSPTLPHKGGEGRMSWLERHGQIPTRLLLFGAGHVGRSLVLALTPLPFAVRWIDSRTDAFRAHIPANVTPVPTKVPPAEVATARSGAFVVVMTHDHALDLAITADALARPDLPFVGLIGSATKRARFEKRFREIGIAEPRIDQLTCPIGLPSIGGREPAVIAASAAAQLLQARTSVLGGARMPEREFEAS